MLRLVIAAPIVLAAAAGTMQLQSHDFQAGGIIPVISMANDCGGQNRSPQLQWSDPPTATKSFALVVHDPDAPIPGGFYHWIVYNIAPTSRHLPANAKLAADQLGVTSLGRPGYYGPCPPPGPPHHYVFTLYALDLAHISADAPLTVAQFETRVAGHVLARTVLTGIASHR
jgi:Raf kinase inhibitor-like YbhB/YbcL family protein